MSVSLSCNWPSPVSPREVLAVAAELAERIGRRFPFTVAQQLCADAPSHLCLHLHAYCPDWPFRAWAYRVLLNLGRDLCRRSRRLPLYTTFATLDSRPALAGTHGTDSDREALALQLGEARQALERIRWLPKRTGNDHYAVLLLQLRLPLTHCATSLGLEPAEVAARFSWTPEESQLRVCQAAPTLGAVWDALLPVVEQSAHRLTPAQVCAGFAAANGGQAVVEPGLWSTWCHRARVAAQQRLGEACWQRLFAHWLRRGEANG